MELKHAVAQTERPWKFSTAEAKQTHAWHTEGMKDKHAESWRLEKCKLNIYII